VSGDRRAAGPVDPRVLLKLHGLVAKRGLSQSFLVNRGAVSQIADLAAASPVRRVIEIGPGLGTLTGELLARGVEVIAVERDPDMCAVLEAEIGGDPGFTLVRGDAVEFDYAAHFGEGPAAVCGNLPYGISGPLLRRFADLVAPGLRLVVMLQLEVAQRIVARLDDRRRGALTVLLDARFESRLALRLSPGSFHPRPKVSSAVVVMTRREAPLTGAIDLRLFDTAVKAAFGTRRKTMRNALAVGLGVGPDRAEALCRSAGIDPGVRAERLDTPAFVALAAALEARALNS
jgi:16S rRNA (adenine1518-N6/adenine1519-N6)-dimethyltransferase